MTETQSIPRPVMNNWHELHHCQQRAAKVEAEAADISRLIADREALIKRQLAEHEALVKELRTHLAAKGREHKEEVEDARWYERYVKQWADEYNDGLMPPPVEEVPLANTAANPVHADPLAPLPPNVIDGRWPADHIPRDADDGSGRPMPGDDPLRSGIYPAAPTIPDGPYGGDGVEHARFHPRADRHPGAGGQRA